MNILVQEIKECMSGLTETAEGDLSARFVFPPDFIGFNGHFPDKPVLPGVCKVQAVMVMFEQWHKRKIKLREIKLAKFFAPVSCSEELVFKCRESVENSDQTMVKALVTSGQKKIATLQLMVL